ncbi:unnamed protein product [Cylicocyclus nassatus]|uniref:Uncharacterized protein n=1 Tax=Cylicocyclus nassatus TaxID=53992 RepID=A0AA36MCC3_CYLNA|nr:unnamed protein product [Cylicocyclus nassatus]
MARAIAEDDLEITKAAIKTWKARSTFNNYPPSVLVDLVARILSIIPPWIGVERDIPMPLGQVEWNSAIFENMHYRV